MNAYPFSLLSQDAQAHAVALYWREVLTLAWPSDLACSKDDTGLVALMVGKQNGFYPRTPPMDLARLATIALSYSSSDFARVHGCPASWLFNHLGERIA